MYTVSASKNNRTQYTTQGRTGFSNQPWQKYYSGFFLPFLSSFFFVINRPWAAQNQAFHVAIAKTPQWPVRLWYNAISITHDHRVSNCTVATYWLHWMLYVIILDALAVCRLFIELFFYPIIQGFPTCSPWAANASIYLLNFWNNETRIYYVPIVLVN